MKIILSKLLPLLIFVVGYLPLSCERNNNDKQIKTFREIPIQYIDYADSLFVLYTLKELGELNWWTFQDYSKMYKLENKDVKYFIGRVFYDSKKLKMMVWYGERAYNAPSLEPIANEPKKNRICPTGGDTIYSMSA